MKMERCPNPACEGGEDWLGIVEDELCVKDCCCWVRCDWCGVAGPVAGTSRESAIEAWNRFPRINSGEEVVVKAVIETLREDNQKLYRKIKADRVLIYNLREEEVNGLEDMRRKEGVDGPVYNAGRDEGRSDVCAVLRAILDPDDKHHWNIDGVLKEVERIKGQLSNQECGNAFWKARCEKVEGEAEEMRRELDRLEKELDGLEQLAEFHSSSVVIADIACGDH